MPIAEVVVTRQPPLVDAGADTEGPISYDSNRPSGALYRVLWLAAGSEGSVTERSRAVFLSYASEDVEAARSICDALVAAGIEVWFDQSELRGGDAWDQQIKKQIHDCALFIPIISLNIQTRLEGYFRREWRLAVDRTHDMAEGKPFLVPVVIDGTKDQEAEVPEAFRVVQWTRLPGGQTPAAFVQRVLHLMSPGVHVTPNSANKARAAETFWLTKPARVLILIVVIIAGGYFAVDWLMQPTRVMYGKKASTTTAPSVIPVQSTIPEKSIAVLPFADMSEQKDQEYFSDGLSEELIDLLAQVPDLRVPARTSSFFFKGKSEDIAIIAGKLRVAHVLEGSVRKSGNTIRVTAQLIRADNGYHLWSKTYDRPAKDIFKIQDEIATSVVQALKATLFTGRPHDDRATTNLDAYNLLLRGRFLNSHSTLADALQAETVLKQAVALDATYAAAWSELSQSYWTIAFFGRKPQESFLQAKAAAEKAVELDPASATAHERLADVKMYIWDWEGAAAEYAAARQADPRTPHPNWVPLHLGCVSGPCHDELLQEVSRQVDQDPLNAIALIGRVSTHLYSGELEAAEHDMRRVLELSPGIDIGHSVLVSILILRHDITGALDEAERIPPGPDRRYALAAAYQALGHVADADRALQDLTSHDADYNAIGIAGLYAMRGYSSAALDWLERAYRQHEPFVAWIKVTPAFVPLREDLRFKALLRKMNLPE